MTDTKVGPGSGAVELTMSRRNEYTHCVVPNVFTKHVPASQRAENPSNKRKSTRFTWWNFFPITLALQFTKVVNIFYCVTVVLQTIPAIQTNSPFAVLVPVCFVILLGILKELIAELKRNSEDKQVNAVRVNRLNAKGEVEHATLATVAVGDLIVIKDGEQVPADCVLIKSELETHEAFVKTAALDGERNLKPKMCIKQLASRYTELMKDPTTVSYMPIGAETIAATKDMYTFNGRISVNADGQAAESYPIDLN